MRKPNALILLAWALHLASWFLPVLKASDIHPLVPGWKAFRLAACGVWPCEGIQFQTLHHAVLATISVIMTLFFVLCAPWAVLRGSQSLRRLSAWVATIAFVFNAHWIVMFGSQRSLLTIGYFLWWLSFLLLALGLFLSHDEKRIVAPNSVTQNRGLA